MPESIQCRWSRFAPAPAGRGRLRGKLRGKRPWRSPWLLVFTAGLLLASSAFAQNSSSMPGWLVPVLQVVTETDVIPGTGVVLGPERVLVPAEFAAAASPLVVLDGGGNLARHGRPAQVLERWPLAGLALLEVPGLRRTPPVLASGPLVDGQTVALWAVAPAELLRQGEATLTRRATITVDEAGQVTLGTNARLPNLTGAVVDACGQWVGHSAARGVASAATAANTLYQWLPALAEWLPEAGFELERARCDRTFATMTNESPVAPDTAPAPVDNEPAFGAEAEPAVAETPLPPAPAPESEASPEVSPGVVFDEPEILPAPDLPPPPLPVTGEAGTATSPGPGEAETVVAEPRIPSWAWALFVVGLVLVFGAVFTVLRGGRGGSAVRAAPAETVAWLRGDDGTYPVQAVDGVADCVLGRSDADVLLTGTTISRHHARLRGTPGNLQLIDLDSTNGTAVNGRPCAPRAGVEVAPGDRLRFGDQEFELLAPGAKAS